MKKLTILTSLIALSLICILWACSKDEKATIDLRRSSINPFEHVGILHNKALDASSPKSSSKKSGLVNDEDILNQILPLDESCNALTSDWYLEPIDEDESLIEYARKLRAEGTITSKQYYYLVALDRIITENGENLNINPYLEKLLNLENTLYNDNSFTEIEKEVIWGSISVARHSGYYWTDARTQPDHPWHFAFAPSRPNEERPYNGTWVGEKFADVKGFIKAVFSSECWRKGVKTCKCVIRNSKDASDKYVFHHTYYDFLDE